MQFSAEKYEKQSSYVIQSTEYNNLLHVHKVRAQSEKLLKGVNIHGLTLLIVMNSTTQFFMTTTTKNQLSDQTPKMHLPLNVKREHKETHLKVF